jgi:hypothetical protein
MLLSIGCVRGQNRGRNREGGELLVDAFLSLRDIVSQVLARCLNSSLTLLKQAKSIKEWLVLCFESMRKCERGLTHLFPEPTPKPLELADDLCDFVI